MNQSQLREGNDIVWNHVAVPLDLPQSASSSIPAPRERTDGLRAIVSVVFGVLWIAPEGVNQVVIELLVGSCLVFSQLAAPMV